MTVMKLGVLFAVVAAFFFATTYGLQRANLRYVGQPIPDNCTAMYVCDPAYMSETAECLRWRVQKITCNKRMIRITMPSYVEVMAERPKFRARNGAAVARITTTTTTGAPSTDKTSGIQSVHIIDVPCVSGFLPDRNGRCREMW